MAKTMLGKALQDLFNIMADLWDKLRGDEGEEWFAELKHFLRKEPTWQTADIDWMKTFRELGMEAEYKAFLAENSGAKKPCDSSTWAIPILKGLTARNIVETLRRLGVKCSLYTEELDRDVTKNDRDPNRNGSYIVRFRRNVEADSDLADLSAEQLAEKDDGITLLERLLLELGYFVTTGKHLDEKNWTLCSGSRDSGGCVPRVSWVAGGGCVGVSWCYPQHAGSDLRSRSAVS
jgi:hypothetical protein